MIATAMLLLVAAILLLFLFPYVQKSIFQNQLQVAGMNVDISEPTIVAINRSQSVQPVKTALSTDKDIEIGKLRAQIAKMREDMVALQKYSKALTDKLMTNTNRYDQLLRKHKTLLEAQHAHQDEKAALNQRYQEVFKRYDVLLTKYQCLIENTKAERMPSN